MRSSSNKTGGMSIPVFKDIDKTFRDLYTKYFPCGMVNFNAKIPETNGLILNIEEKYQTNDGNIKSMVELKSNLKRLDKNLTWIEKWTSKDELSTGIEYKFSPEMISTYEMLFDTNTNKPSVIWKNKYKSENISVTADANIGSSKQEMVLSSFKRFDMSLNCLVHGGGIIAFDRSKSKWISDISYGIHLERGNIAVSSIVTNNKLFQTNMYLALPRNMQVGLTTGWCRENKKPVFGSVVQKKLDSGSTLKARIKSCGFISVSYTFKFFENIMMTLAANINSADINGHGHKVGLEIEI